MIVRNVLNDERFDCDWVLWVPPDAGISRDSDNDGTVVKQAGTEMQTGGYEAWGQTWPGGVERWVPVEVAP